MRPPEIEQRVEQLLRKYNINDGPVPVERIAEAEGLPIIETAYAGEVSGALIRSNGMTGIAVNSAHPQTRRRFTVAHELAHFALNHEGEYIDSRFTVIRRDGRSSDATDKKEIEANAFAANLLMPTEFLYRDLKPSYRGEAHLSDNDLKMLARKYRVSPLAMQYRLVNLGLLSPE
ncbi:protein of unknown function DUF955 [Candidatus Koribacter versatilis Ellin345]|uniref:IrrE N-terminal-like domain-containing protein n=1 Tax=Koribacter versatilis (strain Ellin345) TaxID=204669 RepID=Q1IV69_KORVE|nr:ImmA/IrrE family metallo-endopeptidase [Candidatus Koribacter versatilis]ABF39231.1 protein of unknown function DUF955 [Candidatus Koribacter versatilis Ellin345]